MPANFDKCRAEGGRMMAHKSEIKTITTHHSKVERAYLAGMIDADGSIMLNKQRKHYEVRLDICQMSQSKLEELQRIWGGRIVNSKRSSHLVWQAKADVKYMLESVLHYLKFKVDQAGIILLYIDTIMKGSGNLIDYKQADYLKEQLNILREEHYA